MDDWITTAEAAKLSGYTVQHVRELLTAGAVKGQRFGNVWQVSRRSLLAYKRNPPKRGPKPAA
jgi:excisionase family DNA binding protein